MKYSINWLKELSGVKWTTDEIVDNLTMRAFEVEKEEFYLDEKIIIGEILEVQKHPNADRLRLAKVNLGNAIQEIVCGAPNIEVGQKVPAALLGAILPNGLEIKEAEIRGIKSCGMLCAPDELGLGEDHSGILILEKDAMIGKTLKEYLEAQEKSLEIKVLPDRAHDAFSHVGMAREIATLDGKEIDYDFEGLVLPNQKSKELKVEIKDKNLCPRYIGFVWKGVEIKESPVWLQERLREAGLRPINNVVDATNLIMLELGNPIHAFDLEQIKTGKALKIIIRKAKKDEKIVLLDGEEKQLTEEDLLITNQNEALALAGIMGGKKSGITEKTQDLVIEVANFNAVGVRKTKTKLNLSTDASLRYEKDIDPNLCEKAAVRMMDILKNIAGGELEGIVDEYPKKTKSWEIKLDEDYVNNILGEIVPEKQIIKTLDLLGIDFKKNKTYWNCQIPTVRLDLKTPEDLIEEIGRIWGYKNIPAQPIQAALIPSKLSPINALTRKIRRILVGEGFSEVYNYSFYGEKEAKSLGIDLLHAEIENPVDPEANLFAASLLPNLVKNTALNLGHFEQLAIFEIGKAYHFEDKELKENRLVSGVLAQTKKPVTTESFLEIKGRIEKLLATFDISSEWKKEGNRIGIFSQNQELGFIKIIDQNLQAKLEIKRFSGSLYLFEIDLEKILALENKDKIYQEVSKFPSVLRDISFLDSQNSKLNFKKIESLIQENGGEYLLRTSLFDIFEKDGQASYAFHLEFASSEKTLESEEADRALKKIKDGLEKEGFEIRE